ncbi:uncharacterized protein MELLADRAFT_117737 [Melampsora larici-populina 98AG31]|uniref:Uncharacterized protein n=1 Tax=Melampsora larici-populina (strain 98AG31 / pathotype 3-4-7) TaxID=747676 RepID=F4S0Z4_MELLP|nr:uncharacterized protein MELLADRAFT_117737 [Melampsora larici-populina 98AG31]EGG01726.1 hypothetical protein MELLADRAFT_117737 [Melampsora larici-populina 98AG31]
MPSPSHRTNVDYSNTRRRRASLPGNISLESIPRLTRKISGSLASTSAQAFDWLNNHTKVQTHNFTGRCNNILPSRSRGYSEISNRPAQFTPKPSNPKFVGKDIYGFCLPESTKNDKSKTRGRMVFDKIFPPLSDQPRNLRPSSICRSESPRTARPVSRSGRGLENHSVMRQSIGQFDYPVRCDPIDSNLIASRSSIAQPIPVRPRRPSEQTDTELAMLQRETYGMKIPVHHPVRHTKTVHREVASKQRESYGSISSPQTQTGNEDLNELSYVGLTMSVNNKGNITRMNHDVRQSYGSR